MPTGETSGGHVVADPTQYSGGNVEWSPAFLGNFLNLGYWVDAPRTGPLTAADRIKASENLYRLVARALPVHPDDRLLEVGCGRGAGTHVVYTEFGPAELVATDVLRAQVSLAEEHNKDLLEKAGGQLGFAVGSATDMPFPDGRFDGLYSVEAIEHVADVGAFAAESARVLRAGGRLSVTTFFARSVEAGPKLAELIPTFAAGHDKATTTDEVRAALEGAGFADIVMQSIGEHVWQRFDDWLGLNGYDDHWARNCLKAYTAGLYDYYAISATRA
ncbi:methyltransferase domain-containing protein [Phytohabitans sp. ZYX-F-186]|uniref:Methyltransferase domain-containing protein n=1 Tax=Phytohabitans maris TaxID=3071409 RepID=A0ABU0ZNA2_9ACTN|nr:methyltransferase domain-containing protein [Phytohabitans sp. ZYX-F-186]MDQ7907417.1 methyltransferase domain-containing protein [Phytohabitans sp. ZYX-F-186]